MSTIKANDLTNVAGGIPTVKGQRLIPTAWVNFNGRGTVAIRDSENVSSITDAGTGKFDINFTLAMGNTNYCVTGIGDVKSNIPKWETSLSLDTINGSVGLNAVRVVTAGDSNQLLDCDVTCVQILGGQA